MSVTYDPNTVTCPPSVFVFQLSMQHHFRYRILHVCWAIVNYYCLVSSVGTARAASDFREHYLGPLYPSEQYKM